MANILAHCYHFSLYGNHSPTYKVLELVRKIWYHPNLTDIIQSKIQNCPLCMHHKPNSARYIKLGKSRIASMPRSEWKIDLFHGLRKIGRYSSVVCFLDCFSLYVILCPIGSKEAIELLNAFKTRVYGPFRAESIFSEAEHEIQSNLFKSWCDSRNIVVNSTPANSPFQNSQIEVIQGAIKSSLRIYSNQTNCNWLTMLPDICRGFALRTLSTGHSVEQVFFGNSLGKGDILKENYDVTDIDSYMQFFMKQAKAIRDQHLNKREQLSDKVRNIANRGKKDWIFSVGDLVYLREFKIAEGHSGSHSQIKFQGPYFVSHIYPHTNTAELQNILTDKTRYAHLRHLRPCVGPIVQNPMDIRIDKKNLIRNDENYFLFSSFTFGK